MSLPTSLTQIIRESALGAVRHLIPTWTYATVTAVSPLRVRLDGETAPLPAPPVNLAGPLAIGDRVEIRRTGTGATITAHVNATDAYVTYDSAARGLRATMGGPGVTAEPSWALQRHYPSDGSPVTTAKTYIAGYSTPNLSLLVEGPDSSDRLTLRMSRDYPTGLRLDWAGGSNRHVAMVDQLPAVPGPNDLVINGVTYPACGVFGSLPSYTLTAAAPVYYASLSVARPYTPPTGWGFVPYIVKTARYPYVSVSDSSAATLQLRYVQIASSTIDSSLVIGWRLVPL